MSRFSRIPRRVIYLAGVVLGLGAIGLFTDGALRDWEASAADGRGGAIPLAAAGVHPPAFNDAATDPATRTASDILRIAARTCAALDGYRCTVTSSNYLDDRVQNYVLDVTYRRPGQFRHTIIEGANKGTVLAKCKDGKVHARPGGVLGLLVVEMDLDDKRLLDGRGIQFFQTDWASELGRLLQWHEAGASLRRLDDEEVGQTKCWVIELAPSPPLNQRHRVWINQADFLPTRIETSRKDVVLRDAAYSNPTLNVSPPDSFFKLK